MTYLFASLITHYGSESNTRDIIPGAMNLHDRPAGYRALACIRRDV